MEIFRRKMYDILKEWKLNDRGRHAVLLEGARRVGKSTVVGEFARNEYKSCIIIDFHEHPKRIEGLVENYADDLDGFFTRLQLLTGTELHERDSLIVFDEVQEFPRAREMIKQLVQDGRYDYIETGSLIGLRSNVKGIMIPSEEMHIRMHPMDFEEFLWACGDRVTMKYVRDRFNKMEPMGREEHEAVMGRYRTYMAVGGMPQAVSAYLETKSLIAADREKRIILGLYAYDVAKFPGNLGTKASAVIRSLPSQLMRRKKVFSPSAVKKGGRNRDYERAVEWLADAQLVNPCFENSDPTVEASMGSDSARYKPYFLDTGLLVTLAFGKDREALEMTYDALLSGKLSINGGMFFENMVAQELVARGCDLNFCEFRAGDSSTVYEVDFVIPGITRIVPIEVKSSVSPRHMSLDIFREKYRSRIGRSAVIHPADLRVEDGIVYLPIYMTMLLAEGLAGPEDSVPGEEYLEKEEGPLER